MSPGLSTFYEQDCMPEPPLFQAARSCVSGSNSSLFLLAHWDSQKNELSRVISPLCSLEAEFTFFNVHVFRVLGADLCEPCQAWAEWGECNVESWKTVRLITSVITFYTVLLSILLQGKELERLVSGNRATFHKVETGHSWTACIYAFDIAIFGSVHVNTGSCIFKLPIVDS